MAGIERHLKLLDRDIERLLVGNDRLAARGAARCGHEL
jgi:hypothetical protein